MKIKSIIKKHINQKENMIDSRNKEKLENSNASIICSNCLGGYIYHWLGIQFQSPFINLWQTNEDFIAMLENLETFLSSSVKEVRDSGEDYPVGEVNGIRIYFMHYDNFDDAIRTWNKRKERIDFDNMGIMFSNFDGDEKILERFEALPFKHKVVFVDKPCDYKSAFYIRGFRMYKKIYKILKPNSVPNLFQTQNFFTGKRFIDQFDYVDFMNSLMK